MGVISNLIARLSLDHSAFERGCANSRRSLRDLAGESARANTAFLGLVKSGLAIAGVAATFTVVKRALTSVIGEYAKQEQADRRLGAALAATNQGRAENVAWLKREAEALALTTTHTDEVIQDAMTLATSMGITAGEITEVTKAAVGLSAIYNKDLSDSVRTVTLARQGETTGLKRLGIIYDDNASAAERYRQVLARGRQGFAIEIENTRTLTGALANLRKEWGELEERFGGGLGSSLTKRLSAVNLSLQLAAENRAQRLDTMYKSLSEAQQKSFQQAYQQQTGKELKVYGRFMGQEEFDYTNAVNPQDFEYARRLLGSYQRSAQVQQAIRAEIGRRGSGRSALELTPEQEAAQKEVRRMNDALKERLAISLALANGDKTGSEMVHLRRIAEEAYGKGTKEVTVELAKYQSALQKINELEFTGLVGEEIRNIQFEASALRMTNEERERAVAMRNLENEAIRAGTTLSAEQQERLKAELSLLQQQQKAAEINRSLASGGVDVMRSFTQSIYTSGDAMEALRGSLLRLLEDLQQRLVWQPLEDALFKGLSGGKGGGGGIGGLLGGLFNFGGGTSAAAAATNIGNVTASTMTANLPVGFWHGGGRPGIDSAPTRALPASIFTYAPRLHGGLKYDEFPAILQGGETVRTPEQEARLQAPRATNTAALEGLLQKLIGAVREGQRIYLMDDERRVVRELQRLDATRSVFRR